MTATHNSVSELLASIGHKELAASVAKTARERSAVKLLVSMRNKAELSQSDLAKLMGCTQSRISKIENGTDSQLRISDIEAYAQATRKPITLMFGSEQGRPAVDRIKSHAFAIKSEFDRMVELADADPDICDGVSNFGIETIVNMIRLVVESLDKMPPEMSDRISGQMPDEDDDPVAIGESHPLDNGVPA